VPVPLQRVGNNFTLSLEPAGHRLAKLRTGQAVEEKVNDIVRIVNNVRERKR